MQWCSSIIRACIDVGIEMAKNTDNKRIPVKWIRDKAKAAYEKQSTCYICGTDKDLELHHTNSITTLLVDWAALNKYDISTDDGILAVRDEFIEEFHTELYDLVYTLCNHHHVKLHGVFGKKPPKGSSERQTRWLNIQKSKQTADPYKVLDDMGHTSFSRFYTNIDGASFKRFYEGII